MTDICAEIVITSDVHIRETNGLRALHFMQLLERINPKTVHYLVLNGDIFDFFLGNSAFFTKKYQKIGAKLSELAANGTQIFYLEGNHDFALNKLTWPGIKAVQNELILTTSHNEKIYIAHGDLLTSPWHYKFYLGLVRSKFILTLTALLPQKLVDTICLGLASFSRDRSAYESFDAEKITRAIEEKISRNNCQHAAIGHFHYPLDIKLSTGGKLLGIPSWSHPHILCYDKGKLEQVSLSVMKKI